MRHLINITKHLGSDWEIGYKYPLEGFLYPSFDFMVAYVCKHPHYRFLLSHLWESDENETNPQA